uniref:Immunoglobulin V-set domain-containing protein n=1 Tax=Electrophorus electricus TaxID=8005 RepID=A0AAY5ET03_ELEEL
LYFVVILILFTGVRSYELTQPESLMIHPCQTVTINCKVSTSVTSVHVSLMRQVGGKVLEWIGLIYSDKFSISRDTSRNTVTLKGQNLQHEDTAVCYCATSS